jgi:hypothetical protein
MPSAPRRPSLSHHHALSSLLIHHCNYSPNTPFKMPSPSPPLTQYLLELYPEAFKNATRAVFLERAGKGTLSKSILQKWLSQDRLYAQAYIRFASLLLANIPLPPTIDPEHVNEKLVDLIIDSITNVRRELKFFEDVAGRYELDVEGRETSQGVKLYRALFFETGEAIEAGKLPFVDGLVLLWATEKVFILSSLFPLCFVISACCFALRLGGGEGICWSK